MFRWPRDAIFEPHTYYYANGMRIATAVNGVFSYLARDGLASADITVDSSGNVLASTLYAPYGASRYGVGNPATDYGFTGQHADTTTGLDYYGARYYDPIASQFTSPDTVLPGNGFDIWGLSRYSYVEGNPVVRTDPTGRINAVAGGGGGCYPNPCPTTSPSSSSPTISQRVQNAASAAAQIFSVHPQNQDLVNGIQDWAIQTGKGVEYMAQHPLETAAHSYSCSQDITCIAGIVGTALDTQDLRRGNYTKWFGHELPNILIAAVTLGTLRTLGTPASAAAEAETDPAIVGGWRGTNMSAPESFAYHFSRHGAGMTEGEYDAAAQAWAAGPKLPGTPTPLADGSWGTQYRTPGGGPGGILDTDGNIITFWTR